MKMEILWISSTVVAVTLYIYLYYVVMNKFSDLVETPTEPVPLNKKALAWAGRLLPIVICAIPFVNLIAIMFEVVFVGWLHSTKGKKTSKE